MNEQRMEQIVEAAACGALTRAEMVRYAQGAMNTASMMLEHTPEETTEPMRLLGFGLAMLQGVRNVDGTEWKPRRPMTDAERDECARRVRGIL